MSSVELIYDSGCPNVRETRERLLRAFAAAGFPARWVEWDRSAPDSPARVRAYGSPTVLVDGQDVSRDHAPPGGCACRLYSDETGRLTGVPPLDAITAALARIDAVEKATKASMTGRHGTRNQVLATVPALGLAMLPKLTCAACWPAYAGLLSALGLGFVDYTPYLLPLMTLFMGLSLGSLLYRAGERRGYGPACLGFAAVAGVLVGKFAYASDVALYMGVALLAGASLWHAWPKAAGDPCPACVPSGLPRVEERNPVEKADER